MTIGVARFAFRGVLACAIGYTGTKRMHTRVVVRILICAVTLAASSGCFALRLSIEQASSVAGPFSIAQSNPPNAPEIPTVSYCELVRDPQRYNDKVVRVHAQYRTGFEVSYLYDLECVKGKTALEQAAARQETWLGFDAASQSCWQPALAQLHKTNGGRGATGDVTVVGKFYGAESRRQPAPGGRYQFIAQCLERVRITPDHVNIARRENR
jgi:hypothetical protein